MDLNLSLSFYSAALSTTRSSLSFHGAAGSTTGSRHILNLDGKRVTRNPARPRGTAGDDLRSPNGR